jgi:hypothetical protein
MQQASIATAIRVAKRQRAKNQRINHEETKSAKVFSCLFFVPFISSWLILIVSGRRNAT